VTRDLTELTDTKLIGTMIFSATAGAAHEETRVACIKELHRRLSELRVACDLAERDFDSLVAEIRENAIRRTKAAAIEAVRPRGVIMKPGERLWDRP
jgi:hypothetical protein